MKIVFITGNHPRHAHIARAIAETGYLAHIIVEEREHFIPQPPGHLDKDLSSLFVHHFNERDRVENDIFGAVTWPDVPSTLISPDELNSSKTHQLLSETKPDLLITYGCHMLTQKTLNCVSGEKWNCHGGLSPWYKGAITHFWPSYMLEPQMTGMTVHDLTEQLDAGDVVHQCAADLCRGDTLHQLAARAVLKLANELPQLIEVALQNNYNLNKKKHTTCGMLWLAAKWRPEHLNLIYKDWQDKIVDAYLDGKITGQAPKLHRQF